MNPGEEHFAFFYQVGRALSQWAFLENQLKLVVTNAVANHDDKRTLSVGFLSIDNFRSKLLFADNIIEHKFVGSPHIAYWKRVLDRLRSASAKRNKLAHHMSVFHADGNPGRRFALVPWLNDAKQPASTTPIAPASGGPARPPSGALCLRDVAEADAEFYLLTTALCNLNALFAGEQAPFPEAFELKVDPPPEVADLRRQIRAAFVPPNQSSPQ